MAEIFRMPAVSPTMELGTIVSWRIQKGEAFSSGSVIAEIGTDKATMEAEIFDDGVLLEQLVPEGAEIPLNAPMAIIGKAGEDVSALLAQARAELAALEGGAKPAEPAESATPAEPAEPAASAPTPPTQGEPPAAAPTTAVEPAAVAPAAPPAQPVPTIGRTWMGRPLSPAFMDPPGDLRLGGAAAPSAGGRVSASPLARRVAAETGVDLRQVTGSGPGGRIVRKDVEQAKAGSAPTVSVTAPAPPAAAAATAPASTPADQVVKITQMRRVIAKRLLQSHQDIPTFFLTVSLDVTGFVALRESIKAQLPDLNISYNDMLLAAVARSLREYPQANVSWTDQGIVQHGRVDVGVAVALPEGLITPVLRDADRLRLSEIASTVRALAARAREGKLKPEEYTGGTFTVSNLGMFGIEHFTAIINPPEAAILAVGRAAQVPVVVGGQLAVGWRMDVTMTCDHRVVDGAIGAQFLQVLRRYVETPSLLLV